MELSEEQKQELRQSMKEAIYEMIVRKYGDPGLEVFTAMLDAYFFGVATANIVLSSAIEEDGLATGCEVGIAMSEMVDDYFHTGPEQHPTMQ